MEEFFSTPRAPDSSAGQVRSSPYRQLVAALVLAALQGISAHAQPPVLQRGYDAGLSGATLSETTLTTSNVTANRFGLVFKLAVDDNILAQPLYVPALDINGRIHNLLYVATMSDTLYAFDADLGGAPLWTRNLATFEKASPVPMAQFAYSSSKNIIGNLGILSTPVIDLSTKTLYAVAGTLEHDTIVYRLHAIDITTGVPRAPSGVVIAGGFGSLTFDARNLWQRASLVQSGSNVVFAFGALESESTAHHYGGWVMAYDKTSLAQTGIFATVTSGNGGGGVWQSGRPPAVDGSGHVYVFTGNAFGGGFDGVADFSESVVKLDPSHGLRRVDYFTPSNWYAMDLDDLDLSSSGPMLIPGTALLVGGGKTGVMYALNIHDLGQNKANDTGAVQKIRISASELRGGPVYWQRSSANGGPLLYDWAVDDDLKAFPFNGTTFATTPSAHGSVGAVFPGGILTLSAHSDKPGTGVLWASVAAGGNAETNPPVPGRLFAFDAGNVARELWNSNLDPARDNPGNLAKFVPPLVANGRVYVATWSKQVAVYGILAPVVTTVVPATGTTAGGTSVTINGNFFVPGARVTFGGAAATSVVVASATKLTARTPQHSQGAVTVVVINPSGHSGERANAFTYESNLL